MTKKNLYIISGCNGAGKTTASFTILPEILDCKEFVNTDEIAKGLSPFQPEKVAFEAGRIMLHRMRTLLFFWLKTTELAKEKVKTRVKEGGHISLIILLKEGTKRASVVYLYHLNFEISS
ncbi:hypothetical protein HUE46_11205 [Flavobacterium columnare]|nr:hypothetical protein Pf1_00410 [Flavobacterium columnare]GEM58316.1 hypothetical protein FC1_15540 [Flavobacterium columnare NBRC 100251 = ATCC 23463]APT23305.1 hypothetical protein BU993_12155 [Flavobacterium columnare]OOB83728.1 hypothetical protein BZL53_01180 [Flavobacterium columnare]QOG90524.1 hypothetical protein HUE41_11205 [Flavobacterium columnare]